MPKVEVRKHESIDSALRRFKKACERADMVNELRKREYYEKPSAIRKRERACAVKREARRLYESIHGPIPKEKKKDKDKDRNRYRDNEQDQYGR